MDDAVKPHDASLNLLGNVRYLQITNTPCCWRTVYMNKKVQSFLTTTSDHLTSQHRIWDFESFKLVTILQID